MIEGPNQRDEIKRNTSHPLPKEVLIKNQNNSNCRSCGTKKKLKQGSLANEIEISKRKLNVLPINNIQRSSNLLNDLMNL